MTIYLSLLVAVLGLIMFYRASDPKTQEVGKLAYFSGLLAFLMLSPGPLLKLLGGGA